ncbi:hypothetical protein [Chryseobacterium sp.]|uniref:hypothetical protein n=1 Tax=Chryseobacterium sp. TaxID=1871047 RepID=UPI0011CAFAD2|nr:hypothetical protein [Chryseobacterium sp.]TXF76050.1 hypothetical protein FUA25_09135 [Chryseobacterium sp.]
MIHDKDYIIRIVKQFSEALSKLLLEKNEGTLPEDQRIFDTNMNDTFKMDFEALSALSADEMISMINAKDSAHHIPYFELLGHLFYLKNRETGRKDFAEKAQTFYQLYLQKSGIFSLPIVNRITELKSS